MASRGTITETPVQEGADQDQSFLDSPAPPARRRHRNGRPRFEDVEPEETPSPETDIDVARVQWESSLPSNTVIKVLGVGGGGCNAVASMIRQGFEGVEFYAVNSDLQALENSNIPNRIQIGENLTEGSGAGAIPSIGEQAAREAEEKIRGVLEGADMVFITAGLGGGTGTGAAPVIAEICRSMNILNVAIVTKPFHFEGTQRMRRAMEGCKKLSEHVDTMICLLNDKLMEVVGPKTPLTDAFEIANSVLGQGIRAISDLIAMPGLINVDFRDVRTIMGETGGAVMGVGIGKGENRAVEAVRKACHSPLQEKIVIDGARGILINVTGPPDMTMLEINEATSLIYEMADPEANVIFGVVIDENVKDAMRVTIIATGFHQGEDPFDAATRDEKPRPRMSRLQAPAAQETEEAQAEEESEAPAATEAEPAILRKRERDADPPEKLDFDSPGNPLRGWDVKEESDAPNGHGEAERIEVGAAGPAPARALADSQPKPEDDDASNDPYYETPALHRRRRHRFFE